LRESPWSAFTDLVSVFRSRTACLPSTRSLIEPGKVHSNLPFGPSTLIRPVSETANFTFSGISIFFLPIRDIQQPPYQTRANNSPPTRSLRASRPVIIPREVERIATPIPP